MIDSDRQPAPTHTRTSVSVCLFIDQSKTGTYPIASIEGVQNKQEEKTTKG